MNRILRVLHAALALLALLYTGVYFGMALLRIPYPFALEWVEGNSVETVHRILTGQPIYAAPSLDYIVSIYTPFYFYVSALVSLVTGAGFLALRLVSFAASLGILSLIYLLVRRETSARFAALLSVGLFAAAFRIGGAWLDLARVDSLYLCLSLAAVYLVRRGDSALPLAAAGALAALAVQTKQVALAVAAPLCLYALLAYRRRAWPLLVSFGILLVASAVALDMLSGEWYRYYVLQLPGAHPILPEVYLSFWTQDLLWVIPALVAGAAAYLFPHIVSAVSHVTGGPSARTEASAIAAPGVTKNAMSNFVKERDSSASGTGLGMTLGQGTPHATLFWGLLLAGMIGAGYFGRLHEGGYDNVLMPTYLVLSILTGVAWPELVSRLGARGGWALAALYVLFILQFARLAYDPTAQVPNERDLGAGRKLVETLAQLDGEVLVPSHGYLATMAGKRPYAQTAVVLDVLRAGPSAEGARLVREFQEAIRAKKFRAIIVDEIEFRGEESWLLDTIRESYVFRRTLLNSETVFWPVTGLTTRPQFLYAPREP